MFLYLFFILGGNIAIITLNCIWTVPANEDMSYLKVVLLSLGLTVLVIAIDGLFAFIVRRLPEKWFSHDSGNFPLGPKEKKFWKILGVKKWKDKVLELGMFTSFSKSHVYKPDDPEYIKRFILEANYGVWCHVADVIFGFLVLLVYPKYMLQFSLTVSVINAFLNFLPIGALRYNKPRLETLLKMAERKQNK